MTKIIMKTILAMSLAIFVTLPSMAEGTGSNEGRGNEGGSSSGSSCTSRSVPYQATEYYVDTILQSMSCGSSNGDKFADFTKPCSYVPKHNVTKSRQVTKYRTVSSCSSGGGSGGGSSGGGGNR